MRKLVAVVLAVAVVSLSEPTFAMDGEEVSYVNGTVQAMKAGAAGALDASSATALEFKSSAGQFSIPYASITSYQYREETKFHLGVLPAIAVALVKKRAKVHFVTITWQGERSVPEVVTLEASKLDSEGLLAVLHARATGACKTQPKQVCGRTW
jgi:hypothetical protein